MKKADNYIFNHHIRVAEVRLISETGEQLGIFKTADALLKAREADLDLLMVSDTAKPPVCKIIDLGQYKYQQRKKRKQNRKNVIGQTVKELKISPKISNHDYQVRVNRALEFLKKGFKVKLTLRFRGREIIHPELGKKVIARFLESVEEYGVPDSELSQINKLMTIMIRSK